MIDPKVQLVTFCIDDLLFAIPVQAVDQIIRAVKITPLIQAPRTILGVIDYHGTVIPVMDIREKLGMPSRAINVNDRFIITRSNAHTMALVVDTIQAVTEAGEMLTGNIDHFSAKINIDGISRSDEGLILIYDPDTFLSSTELIDLENALH